MSTTIVCGVDGSSEAQRAASVAARLARDLGSGALLVHVEEEAHKRPLGLRWPRLGRAHRRRKVLRATAEECCFPSDTHLLLKRGDPATELMAVAEKQDAELVVVSARGRGMAGPALLGGTASALMRSCPCPVDPAAGRRRPAVGRLRRRGKRDRYSSVEARSRSRHAPGWRAPRGPWL
jgi:nucleotide-binding universal stress UspA family protein